VIDEALYARLTGDAQVAAIVGTRVRPIKLKQGDSTPALSYFEVFGVHETGLSGSHGAATSMFQIDCWGKGYAEVRNLGEKVRLALHNWRGTLGGTEVQGVYAVETQEDYDQDAELYRKIVECRIAYTEAKPS